MNDKSWNEQYVINMHLDPYRKGLKIRDEQIDKLREDLHFSDTLAAHCLRTLFKSKK